MSFTSSVVISDIEIKCFDSINHAVDVIFNDSLDNADIAVAINPEKVMMARREPTIRASLDLASIRYIDGIGVAKVASSKLERPVNRIPGCELWEAVMARAGQEMVPVFLLGATEPVLNQTQDMLKNNYGVNVVGQHDGYFSDDEVMINKIKEANPKILTVALGSPKQELFMEKCKKSGLRCFMMGVGGTYNVYTGHTKRAPKIWCNLGLEWLYRLLSEPTRINRQVNLLRFLYLYYKGRL